MARQTPLRIELIKLQDMPLLLPESVGKRPPSPWRLWLLSVPPLAVLFYLLVS